MAQYPLKPETIERIRQIVVRAGYEFDGIQDSLDPLRLREIIFQTTQDGYIFSVPFDPDNFDDSHLTKSLQHEVAKYRRDAEKKMTDVPKLNLRQKLIEIYKRVDHVPKLGYNKKQNYYFVRAVDAMRAIRTAFAELGIYAETNYDLLGTYDIKTNSGGVMHAASVKVTIRLYDMDSDETKTISGLGDGADSGDKGIFKAQTGATKNALRNGTLLPDEADPEADTRVDEAVDETYNDYSGHSGYPDAPMKPSSDTHLVQLPPPPFDAGGPPYVFVGAPVKPSEAPLPETMPIMRGDAYEEPVKNILPTEEQLVAYRAKFRTLGDELSAKGKLTANRNLPLTRKLLVFLLSITKASDANNISVSQWDDFFARAEAVSARENGMIDLAKMVNKANGIEPKEK